MKKISAKPERDGESWEAQLRKGSLELAILVTLWNEPLYGLGMVRTLESSGLAVAEGTLYAILNRLRTDELVVSEWRDAGTGHPRKYYTLTDAGRTEAQRMATAWTRFSGQMNSILRNMTSKEVNHARAK